MFSDKGSTSGWLLFLTKSTLKSIVLNLYNWEGKRASLNGKQYGLPKIKYPFHTETNSSCGLGNQFGTSQCPAQYTGTCRTIRVQMLMRCHGNFVVHMIVIKKKTTRYHTMTTFTITTVHLLYTYLYNSRDAYMHTITCLHRYINSYIRLPGI